MANTTNENVKDTTKEEELENAKIALENANKINEENEQKIKELKKQIESLKKVDTKKDNNSSQKEKTYIVEAPVKNFVGEVAGVHFAYGKAEVKEGWIEKWFREKGYTVTEKK